MGKKRVYELAKEYKLSSKEALRLLQKLGVNLKSHMSTIDNSEIEKFKNHMKNLKDNGKKKTEKDKKSSKSQVVNDKKPEVIEINSNVIVGELAEKLKISNSELIKKLMALGIMANVNQEIESDIAIIVGEEFGVQVELIEEEIEEEQNEVDFIDENIEEEEDLPENLKERAPVVTVMGHVDHGKTSLLDVIRMTNVTKNEAGGITQHIGAYQVKIEERKITFLDTPGHAAFTAMRARGAQATDIAVLVVAADDGVMPQTIEAINHAKSANVPIIVAVNKIDKENANPDRVKQQLAEYNLIPEDWGGDTIFVPVSAIKKEGIKDLLEMILLVAEMEELKANPDRLASGIVIEAKLDKGRGPVATVLINKGTLKIGDSIVAGLCYGKVRAMINDTGKRVKKAGPSTPVEVLGLSNVPDAGDVFNILKDEKEARIISEKRKDKQKQKEFKNQGVSSLEDVFKQLDSKEIKELNIVVKADVHGSVEALRQTIEKLNTKEVEVNIIHTGVGSITETDVLLASASNAIIVGFNVRPDSKSRKASENEGVEIRLYRVIYELIDDIKKAMEGLLEPDIKEVVLGSIEIRTTFKVPKVGTIAGCYVKEGKVTNNASIRVIRNGIVVHEGKIESLKRFKDDVKEVSSNYECGIGIENFNDIKEGDILEPYIHEEVKRKL